MYCPECQQHTIDDGRCQWCGHTVAPGAVVAPIVPPDGDSYVVPLLDKHSYSHRQGERDYYGRFVDLGDVTVDAATYHQLQPGLLYRVIFAPETRYLLAIEPVRNVHAPSLAGTSVVLETVPLSDEQQAWLIKRGIAPLSVVLLVGFVALCSTDVARLLLLMVAVVAGTTLWLTLPFIRDTLNGYAQVREARLESIAAMEHWGRPRLIAHFSNGPWLIVAPDAAQHLQPQHRYRVVYSQHSRHIWTIKYLSD